MNFKSITTRFTAAMNGNQDRDEAVAALIALHPVSKAQVWAILCGIMEEDGVTIPSAGTDWDELSQDQRDIVTVYSQVCKGLSFIA